ncbi:unnamed protein product [Lactuca virosa]|uniref:TCP domain-containing protein n=1 Tax=Lactuca virosa TaxID=75947 RepID=A0AAU9LST7_9ASTR|nr:unnamed protein product [Lactuca virosa]
MRKSKGTGEIVEVEGGGRIVRSLRRKDHHSKVCTSKGPRDRHVRLSANTSIQFYDVQDRLGYDRPSKAIDWMMKVLGFEHYNTSLMHSKMITMSMSFLYLLSIPLRHFIEQVVSGTRRSPLLRKSVVLMTTQWG